MLDTFDSLRDFEQYAVRPLAAVEDPLSNININTDEDTMQINQSLFNKMVNKFPVDQKDLVIGIFIAICFVVLIFAFLFGWYKGYKEYRLLLKEMDIERQDKDNNLKKAPEFICDRGSIIPNDELTMLPVLDDSDNRKFTNTSPSRSLQNSSPGRSYQTSSQGSIFQKTNSAVIADHTLTKQRGTTSYPIPALNDGPEKLDNTRQDTEEINQNTQSPNKMALFSRLNTIRKSIGHLAIFRKQDKRSNVISPISANSELNSGHPILESGGDENSPNQPWYPSSHISPIDIVDRNVSPVTARPLRTSSCDNDSLNETYGSEATSARKGSYHYPFPKNKDLVYTIDELLELKPQITFKESDEKLAIDTYFPKFPILMNSSMVELEKEFTDIRLNLLNKELDPCTLQLEVIRFLANSIGSQKYNNPRVFLMSYGILVEQLLESEFISKNYNKLPPIVASSLIEVLVKYCVATWKFNTSKHTRLDKKFNEWKIKPYVQSRSKTFSYIVQMIITGFKTEVLGEVLIFFSIPPTPHSMFSVLNNNDLKVPYNSELLEMMVFIKKQLSHEHYECCIRKSKEMAGVAGSTYQKNSGEITGSLGSRRSPSGRFRLLPGSFADGRNLNEGTTNSQTTYS